MSTRDSVIRAYMAGAIFALAAWFSAPINAQTGQPLAGAILFPVGFSMLYLLGFDLLTGVFVPAPLALFDKRPGVAIGGVLRNWRLVFIGNFIGATRVAGVAGSVSAHDQEILGAAQYTAPEDFLGEQGTSRARTRAAQRRPAYASALADDREIPAWIERNPLLFWKLLSAALAATVVALLWHMR